MTTYYKATRPDGTDFYSGTIRYEVGKRIRPAASQDRPRICGPGYLHAAAVPTKTLVGGSWPCRLFEVSGRPKVGFDTEHPQKGGFRQLVVVRELDAHLVFGPQGREVAALIERACGLTQDEIRRLDAAWRAAWDVTGRAAWDVAWRAARDAAWDAARDVAWRAARDAAWDAARDAARSAAWRAARDAARDVAGALVVRHLISQEHFDILYGPWRQVIESKQ